MKKSYLYWGLGAITIIGIIMAVKKKKLQYKTDDINLLLPAFKHKIQLLLTNLTDLGYDPILRDTGRTQKEAEEFAKKGTGVVKSLHVLGAAADIISASKGWSDLNFFMALGREAKKLGLTWGGNKKYGGDFKTKDDKPHIQAIPVNLQYKFKALTSPEARNQFINLYFKSLNKEKDLPIV